jgi:hypothetical protein
MSHQEFNPYESDEESEASTDSTATDSSTEERIAHDGRIQAVDQWRAHAMSWISGPGRAPVLEGPGQADTGLGITNTKTDFVERRETCVLMVDSLDRDPLVYPYPTQCRLKLPRVYRNVERIDIVQIKLLSGFYTFAAARGNLKMIVVDISGGTTASYTIRIEEGSYSITQLMESLSDAMTAGSSANGLGFVYTASFDCVRGRVSLAATDVSGAPMFFALPFASSLSPLLRDQPTEWGLGWNLGFGGAARDLSGATFYTASVFPRLHVDYIFLRLNDTEYMNTIDHTAPENTKVAQDSTGEVAHFFGKLLLNQFGCYAQTFIESPKRFHPVLGRLERLNFEWTDREGRVLASPEVAACDWHMTLRITEIVETARDTSALVRASVGGKQNELSR